MSQYGFMMPQYGYSGSHRRESVFTMTNRVAEGKGEARSNGRAGGASHARTEADHRGRRGRRDARGFTNVRVRAHEEPRPSGRVSALLKASAALEAPIRAEVREAPAELGMQACSPAQSERPGWVPVSATPARARSWRRNNQDQRDKKEHDDDPQL